MASSGASRGALLDAGGVLSILGGALELTVGAIVLTIVGQIMAGGSLRPVPHISWLPDLEIWLVFLPVRVIIVGILVLVLGVIAMIGGVSTISRRSLGLSFAGAIGAIPAAFLGVLAVTFVALGKRKFRKQSPNSV